MGIQVRLLLLLLYILALHSLAIFLFTSGFLLTRTELPNVSECADAAAAPCGRGSGSNASCWTDSGGVKRAIVVIIDALRFDFLARSEFFSESKPWMDRLTVLQDLAENEANARIFKYVADPPTTTLQRLKGLTTGGLPTFIDVGHSFGAPAIVEDNLILQLARNGKRVVMMGDDTWLQLFPNHFSEAYPFPSFNVKDLHTVDNGVISNIFPKLHQNNWDLLIAHFLGVDHVGHIFGVESPLMVEKLTQYNNVLEEIISILQKESGPGGLHENTMLIVMGDHGQTLNGDHGGGTAEEVDTGLFAMVLGGRKGKDIHCSSCGLCMDASSPGISTLPQLDFAPTLSTILGVPIPFGSVGRVNLELLSLAWSNHESSNTPEHYQNVLCINSWQVMRYLEHYAAHSLNGIPAPDLMRLKAYYEPLSRDATGIATGLKDQITSYNTFLTEAADLARSQWTQFGDAKMAAGLTLLVLSVPVHALALLRVSRFRGTHHSYELQLIFPGRLIASACTLGGLISVATAVTLGKGFSWYVILGAVGFAAVFAYLLSGFFQKTLSAKTKSSEKRFWSYACDSKAIAGVMFVMLHALSLLSNSFIMAEGHVASYLLATIGLIYFRFALQFQSKIFQAVLFLVVNRVLSGMGLTSIVKDTVESGNEVSYANWLDATIYCVPLLIFSWLAIRHVSRNLYRLNAYLVATLALPVMYAAIAVHWLILDLSEVKTITIPGDIREFARLQLPRVVFLGTLLATGLVYLAGKLSAGKSHLRDAVIALFGAWSASILLLLGRTSPALGFLAMLEVWCILELQSLEKRKLISSHWNFLALLLFFCTNHRCTFDGLRYPAAFIGFDEFNLYRQGALLIIDTYGASHVLPIIGLPSLVVAESEKDSEQKKADGRRSTHFALDIALAYLSFGLIRSVTTTFSTICVAIQRRHLMVWGLFAPKYVFDAIGLLITDLLFVAASGLYFSFT
ncbi:GPI ethanolamine phosphate transferase 3 isoform X1 [Selaginella moellendorffii]|uniref:GPI ethanolamine phosphate transferase 3 isoform X1 n=2 Tax=Selaginella moellendorffii TaxID=88036 RepID=UPI000D1CC93E|nr:GPI ethanolamine phosphate transferase 3 isoform X1 [Selaginella moellendorffii]|eukprot:XP_024514960.1 GPI ethanolamine phosphate transferase 3 isoform X1 [Selaginella moellendorffii]